MENNDQKRCVRKLCLSDANSGEPPACCLPEKVSSKYITIKPGCVCCPFYAERGISTEFYCLLGGCQDWASGKQG